MLSSPIIAMEKNKIVIDGFCRINELELSSSAIIKPAGIVDAFVEDSANDASVLDTELAKSPVGKIRKKHKPTSKRAYNSSLTAEDLEKLILEQGLKNKDCLLCLRRKLGGQSGVCSELDCKSKYTGVTASFKLFIHSAKHHHPVGIVVNQNLNNEHKCIWGCRSYRDSITLFEHIITKHVCKSTWLESYHANHVLS